MIQLVSQKHRNFLPGGSLALQSAMPQMYAWKITSNISSDCFSGLWCLRLAHLPGLELLSTQLGGHGWSSNTPRCIKFLMAQNHLGNFLFTILPKNFLSFSVNFVSHRSFFKGTFFFSKYKTTVVIKETQFRKITPILTVLSPQWIACCVVLAFCWNM